jgi:hypothetical protein
MVHSLFDNRSTTMASSSSDAADRCGSTALALADAGGKRLASEHQGVLLELDLSREQSLAGQAHRESAIDRPMSELIGSLQHEVRILSAGTLGQDPGYLRG